MKDFPDHSNLKEVKREDNQDLYETCNKLFSEFFIVGCDVLIKEKKLLTTESAVLSSMVSFFLGYGCFAFGKEEMLKFMEVLYKKTKETSYPDLEHGPERTVN